MLLGPQRSKHQGAVSTVCIQDIPRRACDFRPAHREQTLERQPDRLRTASWSAGAHQHTGICLLWLSSQSAYNSGTSGSKPEEGFLINTVVRLLQADHSSPALHHTASHDPPDPRTPSALRQSEQETLPGRELPPFQSVPIATQPKRNPEPTSWSHTHSISFCLFPRNSPTCDDRF